MAKKEVKEQVKKEEVDEISQLYKEIRQQVQERYEARSQFLGHAVAFFVVVTFAYPTVFGRSFPSLFLGLWSLGLSIHAVNWVLYELRERAIQREFNRIMEQRGGKVKLDQRLVRLSNDGELIELEDDAPFEENVPARRRRS